MIKLMLAIAIICSMNTPSYKFNEFIEKNYSGGKVEFNKAFYYNVDYPKKARVSCIVGKLLTGITISKEGKIEKVEFYNKLGYGLEETVLVALKATDGNWMESDSIRKLDFVVAFQIGETPKMEGDIKVSAYNVNGRDYGCIDTDKLLEKISKLINKKKFKKANKICEELLRRNPNSSHFEGLKTLIDKNLKKE